MATRFLLKDIPIRYKLLFIYATLFALAVGVSFAIIGYYSMNTIRADVRQKLTNTTELLVGMVSTAMQTAVRAHLEATAIHSKEIVEMVADRSAGPGDDLSGQTARQRAARILLSQTIGESGYVYCIDSQGEVQVHPDRRMIGTNLSAHEFVQEQIRRKEGYIQYEWKSPGEKSARPKALFMTYFAPWDWIISASAYREDFAGMVNADTFRDEIMSIRIGDTGYPFIMDSKGEMIVHPKRQGENVYNYQDSNGRRFIQEMCAAKNGAITYTWRNPGETEARKKMVVFRYLPEFDWIIASSAYYEEFYSWIYTNLLIIGLTAVVTVILLFPLTIWINARLVKGLNAAAEAARRLAQRDLSVQVVSRSGDEIGRLLAAVAAMIESLRSVISRATQVATQVNDSVSEMSGALTEQAAVASEQAASVSEISSTMEQFSATSTQISENAESVVSIAENTLKRTREGMAAVEGVMSRMVNINEDNEEGIRQILALRKKTEEIAKVMEIINTIADQTKLIAFNAAIEASGAGESGKRFSVVAVEIRRLADNVMASTGEIESKVNDIQETTEHIVISSEKNTKGIQEALDAFSGTVDLLKEILSAAQGTVDAAKQISMSTRQQKTASQQVVTALKEIDEGTGQTSESINHISDISLTLADLSDELARLMSEFKLPGKKTTGDDA